MWKRNFLPNPCILDVNLVTAAFNRQNKCLTVLTCRNSAKTALYGEGELEAFAVRSQQ